MSAPRCALSIALICGNEESRIADCLESVKWADEIVVVDSMSTDRTCEIAQRYPNVRLIRRPWPGYVAQKNFALEQASGDWVFCIDADERVSPELANEIRAVLDRDAGPSGYTVPRKTFYLGRWILHGGWYPDRKLRLVRRGAARWEGMDPHDHLYSAGPEGALRGDLLHFTYRDMAHHIEKMNAFTTVSSRELAAAGRRRPLLHMLINPPLRFFSMYVLRLGFLDGVAGLVLAVLGSYYVFLKYAKLWEAVAAQPAER